MRLEPATEDTIGAGHDVLLTPGSVYVQKYVSFRKFRRPCFIVSLGIR
jgi:hypothetical protein